MNQKFDNAEADCSENSVSDNVSMANDSTIGFKKPPKHTRFRPGLSGNPAGRPRGHQNLATILAKALREKIVVNENGRRRPMTKLDAAVAQLVDKSASGDLAALRQLMALAGSAELQSPVSNERQLTEIDEMVMQTVLKRLQNCAGGGNNDES